MNKREALPEAAFYRILDEVIPGGDYEHAKSQPGRELYLIRISMHGLEEMYEYSKDERLYSYFEFEPHKTLDDTEKYLKKLIGRIGTEIIGRTAMYWFVRRIGDAKLIGTICIVDIDYGRQSVLWGYAIDPQYWGQGYILEMQEVLKKYGFEELCLNRISGITVIDNEPTISSVMAAGAKNEGILRQYYKTEEGFKDAWAYSILAEDYLEDKHHVSELRPGVIISREMIASMVGKLLEEPNVGVNTDIRSVSKWDSLNHINVILGIEEQTGYKFSSTEIGHATSVEKIYNILSSKSEKTERDIVSNIIHDAMKKYGTCTALKIHNRQITYNELNYSALSIATFLSTNNITGENIGILGQRNYSAYVGILGTVYSGCAYVPINPKYPRNKINDIINEANIRILISSGQDWKDLRDSFKLIDKLEMLIIPEGYIENENKIKVILKNDLPDTDLIDKPIASSSNSNIYIMFTSGSTGKPKGVQVSNKNLSSFLYNMELLYDLKPGFNASHTFDLSFDPSVSDIFFTWKMGGKLCVISEEELFCASDYIIREKINYWNAVPTIANFMSKLGVLKPGSFPDLVYSTFCGEPLSQELADLWQSAAPNSTVENIYGPTEGTIYITRNIYKAEDSGKSYYNGIVPIGIPFHGHEAVIVDDDNKHSPNGEVGEIVFKGAQITKGYLNDPDKTKESYIQMDWDDGESIWYKSGDLGFYNDDQVLECMGRKDSQIKIAGRRVEIGEIEHVLRTYSGLKDVVVVSYRDDRKIIQGVVAYISVNLSQEQIEKIEQQCRAYIENIFFPQKFIFIETFPLTASGKIDRVSLENRLT